MNLRNFFDYFWRNQGFEYDPAKNYLLSWYHIIILVSLIILFIIFYKIGTRQKTNPSRFLTKLSVLLFILEILRIYNFHSVYNYNWFDAISFHICSIGVYLMILAGIFKKKWLFDFGLIPCIVASPFAIIIPVGILPWYNEYSFIPLQSCFSHMLIFFMVVYSIRTKIWTIDIKRYYISLTSFLAIVSIVHYINLYKASNPNMTQSNYFWTRYPDPNFPFLNIIPNQYYIYFLILATLLGGFIVYLTGHLILNRRKNNYLKLVLN